MGGGGVEKEIERERTELNGLEIDHLIIWCDESSRFSHVID